MSTKKDSQSKILNRERGSEENETRGKWSRDEELEIECNIDALRLDGYSNAEIQERYPYSKSLIEQKRELLKMSDKVVGEETEIPAKKRELDLQYLRLIKTVKETIGSLGTEDTRLKLEGLKLVKEIVTDRAKPFIVTGKQH